MNTFSLEVNRVTKDGWSDAIKRFDDATIYQTWSYGAVRWGNEHLDRIVLYRNGEVAAAAQCRVIKLGFAKGGLAYIDRGPTWRTRGSERDVEVFREMVKRIREMYVGQQRLLLRIKPNEIAGRSKVLETVLREEGFNRCANSVAYKTIILDISLTLEELLRGLKKKWRENLRRAERSDLEVRAGTGDEMYSKFLSLYSEMHSRKGFPEFVDPDEFRHIQCGLRDDLKMRILLAEREGKPLAGLIYSAIGDTGIPIFSATGNEGLKLNGSYLLRWTMLKELKKRGCGYLDQGGINQAANPGGYHFKSGMGGVEVEHIGQFQACNSRMLNFLVSVAEAGRDEFRGLRRLLGL